MDNFVVLNTPYQSLSVIKAGAGAGKTFHIQKTLTEWIEAGYVKPDRLLAVTFTNAAASEMRERIRLSLMSKGLFNEANDVRSAKISTIHGFGLSIIERFSYEQGLSPSPRQLTEAEQEILIKLSLSDVSIIEAILDDLEQWGYKATFKGSDFESPVKQFKNRILSVINKLRILSLDGKTSDTERLVDQASSYLKHIYKEQPFTEIFLNNALWDAIQAVTNKYTYDELYNAWGSNEPSRAFVNAIFDVDKNKIESSWSYWLKLQTIATAPRIMDKNGNPKHEDAHLAFNIWEAADNLTIHPGPLRQAINHLEILIKAAAEVLNEYQQLKAEGSLVDFGDMVNTAEQLLKQNVWVEEIKNHYDCLIIDEFQDTNPLQFALLWKIKQAGIPALIVGDIKQSIMGFQGADARLFASLIESNKDHSEELKYNWRSSEGVMEFINALGDNLYGNNYQTLTPMAKLDSRLSPLHIIEFDTKIWIARPHPKSPKPSLSQYGGKVIADEIKRLLNSEVLVVDKQTNEARKIKPNDIAILSFSHSQLDKYAKSLRELGINSQVQKGGWFQTPIIHYLRDALGYLADPNDLQAQMCLKVLHAKESSLQDALLAFIEQQTPKKIEANIIDQLRPLVKKLRAASISQQVISCVDTLSLWQLCAQHEDGEQARANVLKLIDLAEKFELMQPETLEAQGVFGRSLSSFLLWLNINAEDIDKQPEVDSDNENAIVLSTWHAAKGLEWPVVIIGQLEKVLEPSLPEISVSYANIPGTHQEEVLTHTLLDEAYVQVVPSFDDPIQKDRFFNELIPSHQETLKNLCYVAMTRAREQLILPWFDKGKANNMLSLLRDMDFTGLEKMKRTTAKIPDDIEQKQNTQTIKPYGLNAIKKQKNVPLKTKPAYLSPSTLSSKDTDLVTDALKQFTQRQTIQLRKPIDLSDIRKEYAANEVGDWVHQSYQALLANPALEQRLFKKLNTLASYAEVCQQIVAQIASFKVTLKEDFGVIAFQQELPLLATTEEGATISGIIDCLLTTDQGYIVIDHKTDEEISEQTFNHHAQQLAAYAKFLKLDKPVIGIGVNWVRSGCIDLLLASSTV